MSGAVGKFARALRRQSRDSRGRVIVIRALLIPALAAGVFEPAYGGRPFTVDDILKMEDVGRAIVTADGRSLVYEWMAPYEIAPNRELHTDFDGDRSILSKLYTLELHRPAQSRPLFEQDARGGYWLGAPSPDGARLAIYSLIAGELKAGVYDFSTQNLMTFEFTPNYSRFVQKPLWISNDELVYAVEPPEHEPEIMGIYGLTLRLNELWQKSFGGLEPSTTVIRSTPDGVHDADRFEGGSLVRVNIRTGAVVELTQGYFHNLRLAPGKRHLAALKDGGLIQPETDRPDNGGVGPVRRLIILDPLVSSKEFVPCPNCDVVPGTLRWSADGRGLAFLAYKVGERTKNAELFEYVPADQSTKKIRTGAFRFACGLLSAQQVRAVRIGRSMAVFGRLEAEMDEKEAKTAPQLSSPRCDREGRHDWFLLNEPRDPINLTSAFGNVSGDLVGLAENALFVLADGEVWRLDERGHRRNFTQAVEGSLTTWGIGLEAATRSNEAAYTGDVVPITRTILQSDSQIIVLDLITERTEIIDKPARDAQLLAVADAADTGIFRRNSQAGSEISLMRRRGKSQSILAINQYLSEIAEARQAQISYEMPGGGKLSSCLLLPPNYRPDTRYPMIVHAYPDQNGSCYLWELWKFNTFNLQLFAAQDYIVMFPATPRTLIRTSDGPTAAITAVVLAAVDQAIQAGYADPHRIGVLGVSQGYHSALQLIAETDRFKAAVAMHGVSNFSSQYGTYTLTGHLMEHKQSLGNFARYENEVSDYWLGAKPWEDPQRYIRNSPLFNAHKMSTPLLIMHSDFDLFPLGQSEEIFSAMYRLRREATFVTYWGEGHGNLSPANVRDMWSRIFRWYNERLRDRDVGLLQESHGTPLQPKSALRESWLAEP